MKNVLTSYSFKHALCIGLTVLLAVIVSHYVAFSQSYWIFLVAFLVSQTTRGTPFRQGMIFFILILFAMFFSSALVMNIKQRMLIDVVVVTIFILFSTISFINRPQSVKTFFLLMFFPIVLLISTFSLQQTPQLISQYVIDAAIGAAIGILMGQCVFPIKLGKEFSEGLRPVLRALFDYAQAWIDGFQGKMNINLIADKKIQIEKASFETSFETAQKARLLRTNGASCRPEKRTVRPEEARFLRRLKGRLEGRLFRANGFKHLLGAYQGTYPEWVYEVGFNPGLRSGYRFFLINLERIIEVFFSMDYLLSQHINIVLLENMSDHLALAMQKNQELLGILIEYFENKKIKNTQSDFTSDVAELEKALHRIVPDNLELLDTSPNYILLTALVRDFRDLRGLLLQLVMSLPTV